MLKTKTHIVSQEQILKHNLGLSAQYKSCLSCAKNAISRVLETPKIKHFFKGCAIQCHLVFNSATPGPSRFSRLLMQHRKQPADKNSFLSFIQSVIFRLFEQRTIFRVNIVNNIIIVIK